jgi:hypothetical protein
MCRCRIDKTTEKIKHLAHQCGDHPAKYACIKPNIRPATLVVVRSAAHRQSPTHFGGALKDEVHALCPHRKPVKNAERDAMPN